MQLQASLLSCSTSSFWISEASKCAGPSTLVRWTALLLQMLLGLNYMHARKILHRDFKTLNVFLDEKLNVRLGDLGVAKVWPGV